MKEVRGIGLSLSKLERADLGRKVSSAIWILSISLYFYPHLVWCKNTFQISVVDVINKQHCFYKMIKGVIFVHFHLIIGISEQNMS